VYQLHALQKGNGLTLSWSGTNEEAYQVDELDDEILARYLCG
jgi:hypothetical protein